VKQRYIDNCPPMTPYTDPESGFVRMFIPSKTSDNAILSERDPDYINRLIASTYNNEALRRAWVDGDWNVVAGAFFDSWNPRKHVIRPFRIPDHWLKFRGGDWGSARPFAFYWCAVVGDETVTDCGALLPRGSIVVYREWYGIARDNQGRHVPNHGVRMVAEKVGAGLWDREKIDGYQVSYGVLDPSAFSEDGGESIHERIWLGSGSRIQFRPADNARTRRGGSMGGWDVVRARLEGDDGIPSLRVFDTCEHLIRTLPMMQYDRDNTEDLDSDAEDHAVDALRYCLMSRPYIKKPKKPEPPKIVTFDSVMKGGAKKRDW